MVAGGLSWRRASGSSSELARASESGVDRLFSFSRSIAWLLGAPTGKLPWPGLDGAPGLIPPELMAKSATKREFEMIPKGKDWMRAWRRGRQFQR